MEHLLEVERQDEHLTAVPHSEQQDEGAALAQARQPQHVAANQRIRVASLDTANAPAAAPARASAPSTPGEVQPATPPWDTANTTAAIAPVISAAPPMSSRRWPRSSRDRPSSPGASSTAAASLPLWPGMAPRS